MKAIVENPLNVNRSPMAASLYVNMLDRMTRCKNGNELRDTMRFPSIECPVTFNPIFDYGSGRDCMRVRERENCRPLLLVEF